MNGQKYALKLLIILSIVVFVGFTVEVLIDFSRATDPATGKPVTLSMKDLTVTPPMIRAVASPFARAYNNILALLLTFIGLAIPLTANMYTPKLIDIFVRDKVNLTVLTIYAVLTAHSILAVTLSFDRYAAQIPFWVTFFGAIIGWTMLLPYYFYVLTFLNPVRIIALVEGNVIDEFKTIAKSAEPIEEAQRRLNQKIQHLGSVLLKAVDRADRDVVIDAIKAHVHLLQTFRTYKPKIDPRFFDVSDEIMVGMSSGALKIINGAKIWVEQRILTHILLAYNGALGKMPDGVSLLADAIKDAAHDEAKAGNLEVLDLMIRVINTFVREAVKKKDVFSIYNVFYNVKSLVRKLLVDAPGKIPDLARHFKYYADFSKAQGMPFIYELGSYELAELAEMAFENKVAQANDLFETVLSFEGVASSVRLVKSRAILAGYLQSKGMAEELKRLHASLDGVPQAVLDQAKKELLATQDRVFWEITDRGINFDYVEEARKKAVKEFFDTHITPAATSAGAQQQPATAGARG